MNLHKTGRVLDAAIITSSTSSASNKTLKRLDEIDKILQIQRKRVGVRSSVFKIAVNQKDPDKRLWHDPPITVFDVPKTNTKIWEINDLMVQRAETARALAKRSHNKKSRRSGSSGRL